MRFSPPLISRARPQGNRFSEAMLARLAGVDGVVASPGPGPSQGSAVGQPPSAEGPASGGPTDQDSDLSDGSSGAARSPAAASGGKRRRGGARQGRRGEARPRGLGTAGGDLARRWEPGGLGTGVRAGARWVSGEREDTAGAGETSDEEARAGETGEASEGQRILRRVSPREVASVWERFKGDAEMATASFSGMTGCGPGFLRLIARRVLSGPGRRRLNFTVREIDPDKRRAPHGAAAG